METRIRTWTSSIDCPLQICSMNTQKVRAPLAFNQGQSVIYWAAGVSETSLFVMFMSFKTADGSLHTSVKTTLACTIVEDLNSYGDALYGLLSCNGESHIFKYDMSADEFVGYHKNTYSIYQLQPYFSENQWVFNNKYVDFWQQGQVAMTDIYVLENTVSIKRQQSILLRVHWPLHRWNRYNVGVWEFRNRILRTSWWACWELLIYFKSESKYSQLQ